MLTFSTRPSFSDFATGHSLDTDGELEIEVGGSSAYLTREGMAALRNHLNSLLGKAPEQGVKGCDLPSDATFVRFPESPLPAFEDLPVSYALGVVEYLQGVQARIARAAR